MIEYELQTIRIFLIKVKISKKVFIIDSVLETNPCTCKNKDLKTENVTECSYEKGVLLSKLYMSYLQEPDSYIGDKVKVVINLSNYATMKESNNVTGVDTSDLSAKKDFIALKAEVDKLDIH